MWSLFKLTRSTKSTSSYGVRSFVAWLHASLSLGVLLGVLLLGLLVGLILGLLLGLLLCLLRLVEEEVGEVPDGAHVVPRAHLPRMRAAEASC